MILCNIILNVPIACFSRSKLVYFHLNGKYKTLKKRTTGMYTSIPISGVKIKY